MAWGTPLGSNKATGNDDLMHIWMGIGSQIDGLGHMGVNHQYYNGHMASDFVTPSGLTKLSIDRLPASSDQRRAVRHSQAHENRYFASGHSL